MRGLPTTQNMKVVEQVETYEVLQEHSNISEMIMSAKPKNPERRWKQTCKMYGVRESVLRKHN